MPPTGEPTSLSTGSSPGLVSVTPDELPVALAQASPGARVIVLLPAETLPDSLSAVLSQVTRPSAGSVETVVLRIDVPPPGRGLEVMGPVVFDHLTQLGTFYLIGRAFRDGAESLNAVAREFDARDLAGTLPARIPTSASRLSNILALLADALFAEYLGRPGMTLLGYAEGKNGRLTEDGWRAWAATEALLTRLGRLPPW